MKRLLASVARLGERPGIRSLVLAALTVATVFLLWRSDEPPPVTDEAAELRGPAEPDGFIIDGHYRAYDEDGKLHVEIVSPRIEQFEQSNMATLVSPLAHLDGRGETAPWTLSADHGSLLQNENLLYLTGHVEIIRRAAGLETRLVTTELTLDSDQNIAYTDAPVEITDNYGRTRATGMKAWIDKRILELNSHVEGRYETTQ